jgi:CheY-like chemotaxis protein
MPLSDDTKRKPLDRPVRILLAEDNPGDVWMLKYSLGNIDFPHTFDEAKDGATAWKLLTLAVEDPNASMPDLLILDLNLPLMSGSEIIEAINQGSKLRDLPVVIMSSSSAQYDREKVRSLKCALFIVKPIDLHAYVAVAGRIKEFWEDCVIGAIDPVVRFPD